MSSDKEDAFKAAKEKMAEAVKQHGKYTPRACANREEVWKAAIEISALYQQIIQDYADAINEAPAKEKVAELEALCRDVIALDRQALLAHENNEEHVRGYGANVTLRSKIDPQLLRKRLEAGQDVHQAMDSKAFVLYRWAGAADGLGAVGGLVDTVGQMFAKFPVEQFLGNPTEEQKNAMLETLTEKANIDLEKSPGWKKEQDKQRVEVANLMIDYLKGDGERGVQIDRLAAMVDDFKTKDGQLVQIKDSKEIALKAFNREAGEEVGHKGSESTISSAFHKALDKATPVVSVGGDGSAVVDHNFFLYTIGRRGQKKEAVAVNPIVGIAEVNSEELKALEEAIFRGDSKFINAVNHTEVGKCELISDNDLRRRSGRDPETGKELSESLGTHRSRDGEYAGRYAHEIFGASIKPSMMAIAEAFKGKPAKQLEYLEKMRIEDQRAVFEKDGRDHCVELLASAEVMFRPSLDKARMEGKNVEDVAYQLLSDQFGGEITAEQLKSIDAAVRQEHGAQVSKKRFAERKAVFTKEKDPIQTVKDQAKDVVTEMKNKLEGMKESQSIADRMKAFQKPSNQQRW